MIVHLAGGIALHEGRLLLVASHYPNQPQPLWNLPGGRQLPGELLVETVVREVFEETGLRAVADELAYVSESYDGDRHYVTAAFLVSVRTARSAVLSPSTSSGQAQSKDHVVIVEWVPLDEVRERIVVAVVRDPLLAYLQGVLDRRYAGYHEAGITIEWPDDSV